MEILLLSIACLANSATIIILLVFHCRENRWGKSMTYQDIQRSFELQRKMDEMNRAGEDVSSKLTQMFGHD